MKTNTFLIVFFVSATLFFIRCKKSSEETPSPAIDNISNFFEKTEVKKQIFTINVDNGNATVTGEKGTTVTFPQGAFVSQNGGPVSGAITIELKEIYEKSDMVLSNKPTTSKGQLLVSGGEIFIKAFANGQALQLNENTSILITMPSSEVDRDMRLFVENTDTSAFDWDTLSTTVVNQFNDTAWVSTDSSIFYYDPSRYIFSTPNLGWINCDRFYYTQNTTDVNITCNNMGSIHNTSVFIVFHSINSALSAWANNSTFSAKNIPINEEVSIIGISMKNGKEYFAIKDVTITKDLTVTLDLEEHSEESIQSILNQRLN